MATVNTHDTPPFAAYWSGLDIAEQETTGMLTPAAARSEEAGRAQVREAVLVSLVEGGFVTRPEATAEDVLRGLVLYLGSAEARAVIVNLEDLWLENQRQNMPGPGSEMSNWRRKARYPLEEIVQMEAVLGPLTELSLRRQSLEK